MNWAYSFHERVFKELRQLGTTPGIWMNLPLDYEFMRSDREKGEAIRKEVQPCAA